MLVHSIYESISGEISLIPQGSFVTILRLAGCNCHCNWCDAPEARDGIGREYSIREIIEYLELLGNGNILVTGGEPLLQFEELEKLFAPFEENELYYENIIIETNGTIKPKRLTDNDYFVMDFKMPSSGEYEKMILENFKGLYYSDTVKFVCANEEEVRLAIDIKKQLRKLPCDAQMAIGQTWEWFSKRDFNLVQFLQDQNEKDFIVNVQLHKILNCE